MSETPQTPMSGADILVQCLLNHGVEVVFAYPGGASMPIHQSLTHVADRLRTILPRHEQGGGFAAEGYARTTGKVGVCIATSGPGATNFVTCLADAKMDSCPIIAITGQVGTPVIGTDAFQETPIVEVCRAVTKHHYLIQRTEDIVRVFKEAFHIATTGRPGPVIVDVPKDVQTNKIVVTDWDPPMNLPGYRPYRRATQPELQKVLELMRNSKRPIIYAGGGIVSSGAAPHLKAFAERTGIPVALTLLGLGGFPSEHFLCLQMLGMHGTVYANYAINDADLLLALGVRFDDRVTGKVEEFAKHGKIVHIDIDPSEINKNKAAHLPIFGDVKHALQDLNTMLDADPSAGPRTGQFKEWIQQDRSVARGRAAALFRPRRRHPAAVRHPAALADPQGPTADSKRRSSRRAWASIRCGRRSISTSTSRGTGSPAAASARWASACRRRWAPRRPSPTGRSWTSTATAAS